MTFTIFVLVFLEVISFPNVIKQKSQNINLFCIHKLFCLCHIITNSNVMFCRRIRVKHFFSYLICTTQFLFVCKKSLNIFIQGL